MFSWVLSALIPLIIELHGDCFTNAMMKRIFNIFKVVYKASKDVC